MRFNNHRKIVFLLLSLFLILFFGTWMLKPSEHLHDDTGLFYKAIEQKRAILSPDYQDIFLLQNEGESKAEVYKAFYYGSTSGMPFVHIKLNNFTEDKKEQLFRLVHQNKIDALQSQFQIESIDTTSKLTFKETKGLFGDVDYFEGRKYVAPPNEANDWFSRLDNSFFIFFVIALIPFFIMMFHDLILYLTNSQRQSTNYFIIQGIFCLLLVVFFMTLLNFEGYAANRFTQLILLMLIVIPNYFVFQSELGKLKSWTNKGWFNNIIMEEGYKFVLLLSGLIVAIFLGNEITALIDRRVFGSDGYTFLDYHGRRDLEIGFAFAFTLGNFMNNLRRYFFGLRQQNKKLKVTESKALASQAELNAIQASVNPHFLYNSLNSIASLAKVDANKTEKMALALSKFYKYHSNRSQEPLVSIAEEVAMVENYLDIEKIRFGERLKSKFVVEEAVKSCKIPHFLLQPLVENAVKYGYNGEKETIEIELTIGKQNKDLVIQLYDQGKPFDEDLGLGYGLKSVTNKLKLLFPERYTMEFVNKPRKHIVMRIMG